MFPLLEAGASSGVTSWPPSQTVTPTRFRGGLASFSYLNLTPSAFTVLFYSEQTAPLRAQYQYSFLSIPVKVLILVGSFSLV